ncbi:UDP-glucose dehydrogenase family protein [Metabacillus arenae]|uniref:UDP-glucose 6-dehydrogenase n=1 Tax=Metabacillus arenae TaxID=2771434 RepID=A0A926NSC9_9BACI|nr:UDP-glucose/GDP-mannose dehydrogenase family protein [Metabacillus arenae]MBD1383016.1 UDP-glucose/GDP-mannose dehydrogenase family protein [Metabacillus arenae]
MKVTIAGIGYVGLVTGVCLAEIGHEITCVDTDHKKISDLNKGESPIYEPGITELIKHNLAKGAIRFTTNSKQAYSFAEIIFISVGTPESDDGSANLQYIKEAAEEIGQSIRKNVIVVTKSTVPVGTNEKIKKWIENKITGRLKVSIVSNPEFLREGSAIYDTFNGDRIIIGAEDELSANIIGDLYKPFDLPIIKTDIRSAEMIKYASNAFLATKISFINEIANICEKVGANIEDVAQGIGKDSRIGSQFLSAGIGYGGSCFPKDTKALVQIAGDVHHRFELLESVIKVNNVQRNRLVHKAKEVLGPLAGKKAAILGLSFKPNTDDIREAASISMIEQLLAEKAEVFAFDPVVNGKIKALFPENIKLCTSIDEAITKADLCFIATEWNEIKEYPLVKFKDLMKEPFIFDGRNCFQLMEAEKFNLNYYSIGREPVIAKYSN